MRNTITGGAVVLLCALMQPPIAGAGDENDKSGSPGYTFRAGVDLVALNVTVFGPQQSYLTDLSPTDFAVYEDGIQQNLAFFVHDNVPLDLALLLDASASMRDKLPAVREAATGFLRSLRPGDRAEIITFNTEARVMQPFTDDQAQLLGAVDRLDPAGATALYNAIYLALDTFARDPVRHEGFRRPAILLLSDGEDTASLVSFEQALDLSKRAGVTIYPVSIRTRYATAVARHYFAESDQVLRTLARETGGEAFFPGRIDELGTVYTAIRVELGTQYSLGYASKNPKRDGAWRRLVVRVLRPGAVPRTKLGYFAPFVSGMTAGGRH